MKLWLAENKKASCGDYDAVVLAAESEKDAHFFAKRTFKKMINAHTYNRPDYPECLKEILVWNEDVKITHIGEAAPGVGEADPVIFMSRID
jgi:hypothetical protein